MAVKNSTILDSIRLTNTWDYQQRVPKATQAGVGKVAKTLFEPMNREYWNQFVQGLLNRIGMTIINKQSWKNPLSVFKKGNLDYGSTIQEIGNQLIKAHGYDPEADSLFKVNNPESKVAYHTVNREDRYDITINEIELRKAFLSETGINEYVASLLSIPQTSDQYDEFNIMKNLIAEYQNDGRGFFNYQVPELNVPNANAADSREFSKAVRAYSDQMRFLSALYNKGGIPVSAKQENLVLIATPWVYANLDVEVIANAFNVSATDIKNRVICIDEFPDSTTQAILVDKDWFVCADYVNIQQSFNNPQTLNINYYLHRWGVYSTSPFMPAVRFSTEATTRVGDLTEDFTGIELTCKDSQGNDIAFPATITRPELKAGIFIDSQALGTLDQNNPNFAVKPDSVVYSISSTDTVQLKASTYIDRNGKLHVEAGFTGTLHIHADATYTNPSGTTTSYSQDVDVTIA